MALINCPECGKEISDKVRACPHCGYPMELEVVHDEAVKPADEVPADDKKHTKFLPKKWVIVGGVALGVVILAIVGVVILNNIKFNKYIDNLDTAKTLMLEGGSDAESLIVLTANVWRNAIYEESDPETDKYTKPNGWFVDDFNEALSSLFADSTTQNTINSIEANQILVEGLMKELQNPPKGLEKSFETVTDLYTVYRSLTNLAIDPSGSYNSFTESKTEKVDRFIELLETLEMQIPDKK